MQQRNYHSPLNTPLAQLSHPTPALKKKNKINKIKKIIKTFNKTFKRIQEIARKKRLQLYDINEVTEDTHTHTHARTHARARTHTHTHTISGGSG
jgi:DNA repair ATPase RecN